MQVLNKHVVDLAKKANPCLRNEEHKQERDERNLKLQINMRLMKIRSSSLYLKGLIVTGEQDQLQQNDVCFTRKSRTKQNPNPKESDGC